MVARGAAAVALGLVLSGCATGYKPEGIGGGYTDLRLNETPIRSTWPATATRPIVALGSSLSCELRI